MIEKGNLVKMRVEQSNPVQYSLLLSGKPVPLNQFLGKKISLSFNGQINCVACGQLTSKSFAQGFCYNCMMSSALNSECIIRPELCEAHLGRGRDINWEKENHLVPHTVYLAVSSGVKVGVTRDSQIPTRWIDQGASRAIRLAELPNRYLAGKTEVLLKSFISDKTAWQKMLKNEVDNSLDLLEVKSKMAGHLDSELSAYISSDNEITTIEYPVISYPLKVKSISFDSQSVVQGELKGIKGQYLIFDGDRVLNIRKHSGYYIIFQV